MYRPGGGMTRQLLKGHEPYPFMGGKEFLSDPPHRPLRYGLRHLHGISPE
jgi:hypothetical protein